MDEVAHAHLIEQAAWIKGYAEAACTFDSTHDQILAALTEIRNRAVTLVDALQEFGTAEPGEDATTIAEIGDMLLHPDMDDPVAILSEIAKKLGIDSQRFHYSQRFHRD